MRYLNSKLRWKFRSGTLLRKFKSKIVHDHEICCILQSAEACLSCYLGKMAACSPVVTRLCQNCLAHCYRRLDSFHLFVSSSNSAEVHTTRRNRVSILFSSLAQKSREIDLTIRVSLSIFSYRVFDICSFFAGGFKTRKACSDCSWTSPLLLPLHRLSIPLSLSLSISLLLTSSIHLLSCRLWVAFCLFRIERYTQQTIQWVKQTSTVHFVQIVINSVAPCKVALGGVVVSVLATGPKVREFKSGRGRWILRVIKFAARLPSEGK
jgi:hypothetical protein